MSLKSLDNSYTVYKHTTPNGKVYIGITKKVPEDRWASGFGYEHLIYFFRAAADAGITPKTMQGYISTKNWPSKWNYTYSYDGYVPPKDKRYEAPYNAAPVDMYDLSLNFIRTFNSIAEANRFLNVKASHIERVCRGKGLTCHGYIWRYHNEDKNN